MKVLRELINEFAVFNMPAPDFQDEPSFEDQDDIIDFSVRDDVDDDQGDSREDEMDCECNCPHHKKFDQEQTSLEDDPNIEVINRDDDSDDEEFDDVDDEQDDATKDFNFF